MARRVDSGRGRAGARRPSIVVACLVAAAVMAAGFAHLVHEHPHRAGHDEVACAVCTTPAGQPAVAPTLAPPRMRPAPAPAPTPETPRAVQRPLSFSPKQSPPPSA
jgi:hypothetical protein